MLQYRLYNGHQIPAGLQGVLKGSANIGSMFGQLGFGASINAPSSLVTLIDACALRKVLLAIISVGKRSVSTCAIAEGSV